MSARETAIEAMRPLLAGSDRDMIEAALDALLAARSEEPCPTCGGSKRVGMRSTPPYTNPCPDCGGSGTRPLLAQLMEEQ